MPTHINDVNSYDTIIVGAGAAGLFCAAIAAGRGKRVLVLERSNKVGKKILMSGGGRCNFTNYTIEPEHFISANPHFFKAALKRYSQWDFIALVDKHHIEYEEKTHRQLFCKHSAKDILNMLLKECSNAKVTIQTHCNIDTIKKDEDSAYLIEAIYKDQPQKYSCKSLVIATGALSIPTLGGSDFGYILAKQFGLDITNRQAGLVPFMFSDGLKALCEKLSGLSMTVRAICEQNIKNKEQHFFKPGPHQQMPSFNESMLFTHRGISGPAILQISNYWYPGDTIVIDLLPDINAGDWLTHYKKKQGRIKFKTMLQQQLPKAFANEIIKLWWHKLADSSLAEINDKALSDIGCQLNCWRIKPSATEGYRTAEVTLGGISTHKINSKTMEVKDQKGLFFIGEILDVTGHLGGYNFQWAWSSGYSAGIAT